MKEVTGSGKFYAKACDISNENQVINAFEWVEKNFQTVHVLVNNAGWGWKSSIQGKFIDNDVIMSALIRR